MRNLIGREEEYGGWIYIGLEDNIEKDIIELSHDVRLYYMLLCGN